MEKFVGLQHTLNNQNSKVDWITYKAQKAEPQLVISIVSSGSRTIQFCTSLAPYLEYMIQMQH